ncbi:calcium and integrin-binding family member 3 [Galendromus occidentalis]|uniref:Calcium and integrin-binding family member 3 n=1 Tax=Galendromus occidentalis TaxID=34638 RepID=A0AAJ6VXD2_9ACAR|nr:calcium and integrin-binding family member 3 [Galendromus occidentalis]
MSLHRMCSTQQILLHPGACSIFGILGSDLVPSTSYKTYSAETRSRAAVLHTKGAFRIAPPRSAAPIPPKSFTKLQCHSVSRKMGNKVPRLSDEQLEDLQDCTFFTRKEILTIQHKFVELDPQNLPRVMTNDEGRTAECPVDRIEKMPEFKENPFRRRIAEVFSESGSGNMCFEDFLDMLSVFSEAAPKHIKMHYAFKIYDYDSDGKLGPKDIELATVALTKGELSMEDVKVVVEKVLDEGDIDSDGHLSLKEFEHVLSRAPDFVNSFHVRA